MSSLLLLLLLLPAPCPLLLSCTSRFANTVKPFACKDIKIALSEIRQLEKSIEDLENQVRIVDIVVFIVILTSI